MTIKSGTKVRVVSNNSGSCHPIGFVGVVGETGIDDCRVEPEGYTEGGTGNWYAYDNLEVIDDAPKTWGEMSDAEKGALLLAAHEGETIQVFFKGEWSDIRHGFEVWASFNTYRVRPEPNRETATLWGYVQIPGNGMQFDDAWGGTSTNTHKITFELVDGKPDVTTIKMGEI